jgi:sec-independent protein translocase protein TatB
MFDISFFELLMIAIVALLVLGPERLPKAARFAGLWVRRARAQWQSVKSELENELAAEELKRSLQQTQASLREAQESLQRSGQSVRREFESLGRDVQSAAPTQPPSTPEAPADDAGAPPVTQDLPATHDDHDRR